MTTQRRFDKIWLPELVEKYVKAKKCRRYVREYRADVSEYLSMLLSYAEFAARSYIEFRDAGLVEQAEVCLNVADRLLRVAVRLDPSNPRILNDLAVIRGYQGRLALKLFYLVKALEVSDGCYEPAHINLKKALDELMSTYTNLKNSHQNNRSRSRFKVKLKLTAPTGSYTNIQDSVIVGKTNDAE